MSTEPYPIRPARPQDLAALPIIERAAAQQFRATPYAYLADDDLVSTDVDLDHEYVWVVVDQADQPIGFALAHVLDESVHLHELDVHPRYARQGLGRRLIAVVADWAHARGVSALTLTTFADIPWNGPYYGRLGFRMLDLAALSPGLQAVRLAEAANGLPMEHRICMQLDGPSTTDILSACHSTSFERLPAIASDARHDPAAGAARRSRPAR
jgi:GNAT superfamily N-acetyltransferase